MKQYRLSDPAIEDLDHVWRHIARDNPDAATRTTAKILKRFQILADFPGIGQRRDDLKPDLRTFPVGSYLILYFAKDGGIEVLRVLHGARDLRRALSDKSSI